MDYAYMMGKALSSVKSKVKMNQKFEVKDLFEGCEWEKISKGDRIKFGKYFKNEVSENHVPGVRYSEKEKNNHALYIRTM